MTPDFHGHLDAHRLYWLCIDQVDSPVNLLGEALLEAFDEALVQIAQRHPRALIIGSDKPTGFIAGADVRAFAGASDTRVTMGQIRRAHQILQRLESLAFPTVAAIHGHCLGGGLELALACDYRVCSDADTTRLGFPEVRLGIFPGFGGTLRATRLLGDLPALRLMLSGRPIDAHRAARIGLVDRVVPVRQLDAAARDLAEHPPARARRPLTQRLGRWPLARGLVQNALTRVVARHVSETHNPAPYALLAHWRTNAGDERRLLDGEARHVAELLRGRPAQNLIRLFLLRERLKAFGGQVNFAAQRVHVIGAGVMGADIAAWCALQGVDVSLQDPDPNVIGRAVARAHALCGRRLESRHSRQAAIDRLTPDRDGHGVTTADLVIEAVPEDVAIKRQVFAGIEDRLKPDAICASNTSSIPLEDIAERLARPGRLVGLHFFNPVTHMPLVEVVCAAQTDDDVVLRAAAFTRQIGKLPLEVKSAPGFLVNRVLMPYLLEAIQLLDTGIDPIRIDRAAVDFGMPVGPIELADRVGLDVCLAVAGRLGAHLALPVPARLSALVEAGHLGQKTGLGFYRWRSGQARRKVVARQSTDSTRDITDRLILRLVNESVACLREGIVHDADLLDAGVVFGTGFAPSRGGPLRYAHDRGNDAVATRLRQLERRYGNQFHADGGWAAMA